MVRKECLDRLGVRHLRTVLCEYLEHYHTERNHQGIENRLIKQPGNVVVVEKPVRKRERLRGMLNFYYREAA